MELRNLKYLSSLAKEGSFTAAARANFITQPAISIQLKKLQEELGEELMGHLCRHVFLRTIDAKWRDHLYALDNVREGIGLRAYGQKDPLVEYKQESFRLFEEMMDGFQKEALTLLFRAQVRTADEGRRPVPRQPVHAYKPATEGGAGQAEEARPEQARRTGKKVGRNEPCPCGSGKKYKHCCGRK